MAERLLHLRDAQPLVLALPRGGVPVGLPTTKALDTPLDLLMVRTIGTPGGPEYGIGAVVDGQQPEAILDSERQVRDGLGSSATRLPFGDRQGGLETEELR